VAHDSGRRVGVVSSVQLSHATPAAAAGAHHARRQAYCELAVEMLGGAYPDVLAGTGHPEYDNNGRRRESHSALDYRYVGGKEIWDLLRGAGRIEPGQRVCAEGQEPGVTLDASRIAALEGWDLVETRAAIEGLRQGPTPRRPLLVPQVGEVLFEPSGAAAGGTLQQGRGSNANPRHTPPSYDPPLSTVPSLASLTEAALNALDESAPGFFLHVEGGAVDWAMHANQLGRTIEEMLDFTAAVEAVVAWVERHGGWDETLVVVTADHDHMLWGPNSETVPFDPLVDNGPGKLPGHRWLSDDHSNALVPVFVRGPGAEALSAGGQDPFYGPYVDQSDLFRLMRGALETGRP
jgi:alkaline phosphatase